ncbi:phosphatidylglycerol lysyltransferase domain-containing protein [Clostridium sp. E02]|uniref:DUF2156 domain-containing protein n=1 Tax=Clostridium sp. E02 TaxID=2487134 RepID=UPI000F51EEC2|nr:phosphatidylglycerol lysyltransferase domain-containing protein [Clostridium sp. E02]
MNLQFKPIEAIDVDKMRPFYALRPNKTCDSVYLDSFIWREYYHVKYAISDNNALQFLMEKDGKPFTAMPMCKEEDLSRCFKEITQYFNQVLKEPLCINLADEAAIQYLNLDPEEFEIKEVEDLRDYLYDADKMKSLSGKKLHKKKNHLNSFLKQYEGRYEYRTLCCSDRDGVVEFLNEWWENKVEAAEFVRQLDYEVMGIHEILKNCSVLNVRMAGVFIDGKLRAFTIGSYNPLEKMAVIHIEKADPTVKGLYQFINQQFLIHAYPEELVLVNREDDVGMEGLRRAKMSYYPVDFARKYSVVQKGM